LTLRHSRYFEVSAKNPDVSISMDGNPVDAEVQSEDLLQGMVKREIVNSVATVQQCAIDVEEISVCRLPIEARLYVNQRALVSSDFGSTCPSGLQVRTGYDR